MRSQRIPAAFGLNGADETHISEVDIAGVSLAVIQELNSQMKITDAPQPCTTAYQECNLPRRVPDLMLCDESVLGLQFEERSLNAGQLLLE